MEKLETLTAVINGLLVANGQSFTLEVTSPKRQRYNVSKWDASGNMIGYFQQGITFQATRGFLCGYVAALRGNDAHIEQL